MKRRKKIVFLSHFISKETPLYKNDGKVIIQNNKSIKKGDPCNTLELTFPNHCGTHIDLPSHFINKGRNLSNFKANFWVFKHISILEIKVNRNEIITPKKIKDKEVDKRAELMLIKTGFESNRKKSIYWKESPGLHPDLADYLIETYPSLRCIGIDFISISSLSKRELGRQAHRRFLSNRVVIIEDMKLSPLERAPDFIMVSPLLIEKADGAPCTILGIYH